MASSLELRSVEQAWLSRRLHDDLGPSLCAAGLQLSLFRTELGDLPPASAEALDNVQGILENAVDSVRLLSYVLCPAQAGKCGLRDMARMAARAFNVEAPEFDHVPKASPAASVELAGQLLDCLLTVAPEGRSSARIMFTETGVLLEAPGEVRAALSPIAQRPLRHWTCSLSGHARRGRATISWDLAS